MRREEKKGKEKALQMKQSDQGLGKETSVQPRHQSNKAFIFLLLFIIHTFPIPRRTCSRSKPP